MAATIDQADLERFVSSVWSMTLALSCGRRACGDVLKGVSSFLTKFADTLEKGSPEIICVKSHNAVVRQLIVMSNSNEGIPVADLRHVGKSLLEYICIDMLFDDEEDDDYSDEDEEYAEGDYNTSYELQGLSRYPGGSAAGPSTSGTIPVQSITEDASSEETTTDGGGVVEPQHEKGE